jgi:hemerythrin-like domain-containing protein
MKRHPSLAHLSRDHHGALILARLLQKNAPAYKGLPTDVVGKGAYANKFYTEELVKHFSREEKALQLVKEINEPLDKMLQIILKEHVELHAAFHAIINHNDLPTHLDELGKALETHVRKEERELFPLIEESCNEELLAAIDASLSPHL